MIGKMIADYQSGKIKRFKLKCTMQMICYDHLDYWIIIIIYFKNKLNTQMKFACLTPFLHFCKRKKTYNTERQA